MVDTTAITAKLSEYDFIVVIDKSGSMGDPNKASEPKGRSRWEYVQESAVAFCREIEKIDSDGLGLVLFSGSSIDVSDGVDTSKIRDAFAQNRPGGGTPLAEALTAALKLAGKSDKKDFIVVFTDGVPDDKAAAAKVIKDQSNKQAADDELTFLFVQVGDDASATRYLQELDDNLKGAKFDIVDTMTVDEADKFGSVAELVMKAIND